MSSKSYHKINRRDFLRQTSLATSALAGAALTGPLPAGRKKGSAQFGKKVIIIGIDGMDPVLTERMMDTGKLPHFAGLRARGGYRRLGTSIPPQSPVAWANFINGAGPGSHGIFDFIHRNPQKQVAPYYSAAETVSPRGHWDIGEHRLYLDFWPFNHQPPATVLRRRGTPFWDYLDRVGIASTFYNLPANYPPSPSRHSRHRCLAGMGTPDLLGSYGTYQHYSEDGPVRTRNEGGGQRSMLFFENETARAELTGPTNIFLQKPRPVNIEFLVHRDIDARAAVIEIQKQKILLKEGQWSRWIRLDFPIPLPNIIADKNVAGICRFYLQEAAPNFRLYVTPLNADPSDPAITLTEPPEFSREISQELGMFYTTGFQEDHKALSNGIFTDEEFAAQAQIVLQERLNMLDYAIGHYDEGVLFFYFSSTDLQSHMFWWDSHEKHPTRSPTEVGRYFRHLQGVYQKMDEVLGSILRQYDRDATVIVMSDHGFANFKRQFNLNAWLRDNGYLGPAWATSIMKDVDWSKTRAYGLGINGLYVNLKGRERDGIVEPGAQRETLLDELVQKLEAIRDENGRRVIRKVHRAEEVYTGDAVGPAPDLIVGYARDYRASWSTCLGDMDEEILSDNDSAWAADHCADVSEVPGVIFSNRPLAAETPELIDIAPSVLKLYGLDIPPTMTGKNIFTV